MTRRLPTIARAAAPFVLTALLLWLLSHVVDPRAVLRQLAAVRPVYFAAAIALMLLSIAVATMRYQTVLAMLRPKSPVKFLLLLGLNLLTLFCAHFVPFGAIADAMRALVSRRLLNMPVGMAVEGVVADRVLAVLGFALFGLLLLPLQILFGWPWPLVAAQALTFGGLLVLVATAFGVTRHPPHFLQPVAKAVRRFAAHVAGPGDLGWQLGFAAAGTALFAAMLVLLGLSLGLHISPGIALAVTPAIYLSQVIPIFYAGFGSRELALAALFVPNGVLNEADAVALGLSIGLCNLAASLPGAVSAWPLLRALGTNAISARRKGSGSAMKPNTVTHDGTLPPDWALAPRKSLLQSVWDLVGAPLRMVLLPDSQSERLHLTSLRAERYAAVLPELRGRVLDVGAGDNTLIRLYRQTRPGGDAAAAQSVGVDVVDWGTDTQKIESSDRLPFADASFDTVCFVACLNHIPERIGALKEAHRVLRPGGRVVATMIGRLIGDVGHAIWWYSEDKHRDVAEGEVMGIDSAQMMRLFEQAGFRAISTRRFVYGMNYLYLATRT